MRSMADPAYVYRPHSPERRERQRQAALRRHGVPLGYRRVYGVLVPERLANIVQGAAAALRHRHVDGDLIVMPLRDLQPVVRLILAMCLRAERGVELAVAGISDPGRT